MSSVTGAAPLNDEAVQDHIRLRRGIVTDEGWPFRLDIKVEYQDWILVAMCFVILSLWCMPCLCGLCKNGCSRRFTGWVYTRMHTFYWAIVYATLLLVMFTVGILPDWSVQDFLDSLGDFCQWTSETLDKLSTCAAIVIGLVLMLKFRERLLYLTGMEHITIFRFNLWRSLGFRTRRRPIELFIWKVEGLRSGGKLLKANDLFVEVHLGDNEPMRTRVHNNAGNACELRESLEFNIDENSQTAALTLLVMDQGVIASGEVARLRLATHELLGIEDSTGKRKRVLEYSQDTFVELALAPQGRIWLAVAPVEETSNAARDPFLEDDSLFLTC
mmetsp:Transcript_53741/g.114707  ORF Transcript_53741/g.114707 Transcript_53741/m.114707 type:complete len:330 (+) Transcript_53741:78-1067(+)|eukprot:CAMPEP_0206438390 /NCGR_PEP_ID=MMETSP0324_2-20121206/11604_1 /ASSEMBLY_ACC=CAM_ASM_000836 /TAXON_ID=2866 /ORGANISM="Crypthecodinium cohnii, Strain Seligo" /LENGTH=329 /DNA_ID=CAMNT_0053905845 /DNA_START=37 /DNA_END=1026 /DNA_ORIENTATION=+